MAHSSPTAWLYLLVAGWVCLSASTIQAQRTPTTVPGFSATTFTRVDGLPQNGITALTSTPDGFLWIGSQAGLARFDGISFVTFDKHTTRAFKDHFVTSLTPTADGGLWVGTRLGLINRDKSGRWRRFSSDDGLGSDYVRTLYLDHSDSLFVGTYGSGISRLANDGSDSFSKLPVFGSGLVRAIHEDSSGRLWVASIEGLHSVKDEDVEFFGREDGLTGSFVRSLTEDARGNLWIGTEEGGLLRFADGQFHNCSDLVNIPDDATVWALLVDRQDHLWIGTEEHGVRRLRDDGFDSITTTSGLNSNLVWSLHEDLEGSIWIGTRAGLTQLKTSSISTLTTENGLSDNRTRTVLEDTQGRLWVGTMNGLDRMDLAPGSPSGRDHLMSGMHIRALSEGTNGAMWVGTDAGLFEVFEGHATPFAQQTALSGSTINAIAEDHDGCMWIGTGDGGLNRFCAGRSSAVRGLEAHVIRSLLVDRSGTVWIGSESGLAAWSNDHLSNFTADDGLPSRFVYALHEDDLGVLWLGTSQGLVRYSDQRFHTFSTENGLPVDLIFQILEDDSGNLWLSTQQGLVSVQKEGLLQSEDQSGQTIRFSRFDESDGMLSSECNGATQPAGWKTSDGRLLFPTYNGVAVVTPQTSRVGITPPTAIIDRFVADGTTIDCVPPVALPAGTDEIELHFTAPHFVAPSTIRFKYRLDGYHQNWVEIGPRRIAHFTNLRPGDYTFRVLACNDDGVWSEHEALVPFEIKAFFWQTRWFLALVALLIVIIGPATYKYRMIKAAQRERELENVVALRTAELADVNQKLEKLASVDGLTEIANHRQLRTVLRNEWQRHSRSGKPLSVLIIDVDHFKLYNDHYGHLEGDRALRDVARVLARAAKRPGDLAARHGGEEFAVVLSETGPNGARDVAEKVRKAVVESMIRHEASPIDSFLTISIGVATIVPSEEISPDTLLSAADKALYEAKNSGRNTVRSAPSEH